MGFIEISDGITNRRQEIRGFHGTIRIELTDDKSPTIIAPDTVTLQHSATEDAGNDSTDGSSLASTAGAAAGGDTR